MLWLYSAPPMTDRPSAPVSVLVLTYNEALNIEHCLRSVAGWCREIHVVDSGSTDATLDIVRAYTDHVYTHEYVDHRSQLTWAFEQVPFSTEWILLLDADNAISSPLQADITRALSHDDQAVNGFYLAHQYYFRGKPIRGFKPWSLRLLRKGTFEIDQSELVDFRIVVRGRVGYLPGVMTEQNRKEDDLDFWIDKHQTFSSRLAAEEVLRRSGYLDWSFRPKLLGSHDERIVWLKSRWYTMPLKRPAVTVLRVPLHLQAGLPRWCKRLCVPLPPGVLVPAPGGYQDGRHLPRDRARRLLARRSRTRAWPRRRAV